MTSDMQAPDSFILLEPFRIGGGQHSITDWAFAELWQRIVAGDLAPGAKITEEGLAESLNVSRTPLREALRRLEETGLILRQRNRTLQVAPLSIEEMVELSKIRERLEGLVAREAALRVRDLDLAVAAAERIVHRMEALQSTNQFALVLRLGDEFHAKVRELSGLERTSDMLRRLLLAFERYRYLIGHDAVRVGQLVSEHREILEAIGSGDPRAAESEMCRHIAAARKLYLRRLEPILAKAGQRRAS